MTYYLRAFLAIKDAFTNDKSRLKPLLSHEEELKLQSFDKELNDGARLLLLRLYLRKRAVFRLDKIKYSEIEDIANSYESLKKANWTTTNLATEEMIDCLAVDELRLLAESYLGVKMKSKKSPEIKEMLLSRKGQRQMSLHFGPNKSLSLKSKTIADLKSRISDVTGTLFALNDECYVFFARLELLFFGTHEQNLSTLVLASVDKVKFPYYRLENTKRMSFFESRSQFLLYEKYNAIKDFVAYHVERIPPNVPQYLMHLQAEAEELIDAKSSKFQELISTWESFIPENYRNKMVEMNHSSEYMIRYDPGWPLSRIIEYVARESQRRKDFCLASTLYMKLLGQWKYCKSRRGKWWTRLVMHVEDNLTRELCENALEDPYLRSGCKLGIENRLRKISKKRTKENTGDWAGEDVRVFKGLRVKNTSKCIYETATKDGGSVGVEEYALMKYAEMGYKGVHAEGTIISTLFTIFFWDEIFDSSIPCAFIHHFQSAPLDFGTDTFFCNREEMLKGKLQSLTNSTIKVLTDDFRKTFESNYGVQAVGVSWDNPGLEGCLELIECMGGPNISKILGFLAEDYRNYRGGFPDLTLWQSKRETAIDTFIKEDEEVCDDDDDDDDDVIFVEDPIVKFKFVEVKSQKDRLSDNQRVWRSVLASLGKGHVEICRILNE